MKVFTKMDSYKNNTLTDYLGVLFYFIYYIGTKLLILYLLFLLLINCQSTQPQIEKPVDVSPVLKQVEESTLPFAPGLKENLIKTLKNSQDYMDKCYSDLKSSNSQLEKIRKELEESRSETDSVRKEMSEYKNFYYKFWSIFWIGLIIIIGGIILYFFGPQIMNLLKIALKISLIV